MFPWLRTLSITAQHMNSVFTPKLDGVVKDKGSVSLLWLFPKMFFWEGPALLPLLQVTGDPGARGVGMERPGWGEWLGNGGIFLKRFQCPVLRRMLGHVAVLEFCSGTAQHSHGWHLPSIPTCHSYSCWVLPPRWVEMTLGSINQETNYPCSLLPSSAAMEAAVGGELCRCKIWGGLFVLHSGLILSTLSEKKNLLMISCQGCVVSLVYLLEMWLLTYQNVSKNSAEEHNTRSR